MNSHDLLLLLPESFLTAAICVLLVLDLFVKQSRRSLTHYLSILALAVTGWLVLCGPGAEGGSAFGGMFLRDSMATTLKLFVLLVSGLVFVYARPYLADRQLFVGEYYSLCLFAVLGMLFLVSAGSLVMVYLGLELLALSSYALVGLNRDSPLSSEAAMKYFVLGALASGMLLYGMSMIYGATGTLEIPQVAARIAAGKANTTILVFGLVFIVAGLAFKLGAVPFHMWLPDVYQGAPTAVTLLIGSAPEFAAFAITIRLLVEGMLGLAPDWQQMFLVMAVGSLVVGNIAAIAQTNLKRMLAYSTIAQIGFVVLGLSAGVVSGNTLSAGNAYSSAMFYLVAYVLTTLGTFGLIMYLSRQGFESEEIADFAGLARRSPWVAGMMTIFMFSLMGMPPFIGFFAKLAVLQALVTTNLPLYITLAVVAVLLSLVGVFYYLRVVKVMWIDEPPHGVAIEPRGGISALLAVNGAAVLLLGMFSGGLMAVCRDAGVAIYHRSFFACFLCSVA